MNLATMQGCRRSRKPRVSGLDDLLPPIRGVPDPKLVVVIGDCGACDGLFDSSYASRGSVENVIPVHRKIHGCPPNPAAILLGILETVRAVRIES